MTRENLEDGLAFRPQPFSMDDANAAMTSINRLLEKIKQDLPGGGFIHMV